MAAEVEIIFNATDNASGTIGGMGGALGNLGSIVSGVRDAFDLVSQGINAAVGFVQPFIDSASESEQAVAELEQVLRATGGAAGLTSEELQDMADGLQGVTMFSDEAILGGQSMLLTFRNIGEETFPRATEAMLDMGQMFGSVDAAAVQLGKALNDPIAGISALQRIGVTFTDEQRTMIENFMETGDIVSAQNVILAELEAQIGGVARAAGETFAGQMEIARNKLDGVKEVIGMAILPLLSGLLDKFGEFMSSPLAQGFIGFFEDLGRYLGSGVEPLAAIGYALNNVSPALHDVAIYFLQLQDIFRQGGGLGDLFNEIFSPENLQAVGEAFTNFTASIDWNAISNRIADGIASIDWGRVGNIISQALGYLAIGIGNILGNIDWSALLNSIGNAIADLMAGLFGFIDWEDMISNAEVGFRYVGQSIVDGLRAGLLAAWTNFTNLPSLLFNNFITSVKALLGISSPSTIFAGIGRDIVLGLTGGFLAYWDDLIRIATTSLDNFLNLFGIDLSFGGSSASGLGSAGGGTAPDGSTTTGGQVINNFYGPVTFGDLSQLGYDCPSPHPLVASSGNQLVTTGF